MGKSIFLQSRRSTTSIGEIILELLRFFREISQKKQLSELTLTAASDGLGNLNNYVLIFVLIIVLV